jgi:hypothetical protein
VCQQGGKWAIAANTKGFAVCRKTGTESLLFLTIYGSSSLTNIVKGEKYSPEARAIAPASGEMR